MPDTPIATRAELQALLGLNEIDFSSLERAFLQESQRRRETFSRSQVDLLCARHARMKRSRAGSGREFFRREYAWSRERGDSPA